MKETTNQKIDRLTDAIERLVSKQVAPVAPVLPVAPVAPIAPLVTTSTEDHVAIATLVVSVAALDTKVTEKFLDVKNDIRGLSDGTSATLADHEARLRTSEAFRQGLIGKISVIAGVISIVVTLIVGYVLNKLGL
jgi:hypothetical protein